MEYIEQGFLVVVFILNGIGSILKAVPKLPNWTIPLILLGAGLIAGIAVYGFNFAGVTQGAVAGLASVGVHQVVTQRPGENFIEK